MTAGVSIQVLDALSTALWQERRSLEQLQFKLQELQLLVDAGGHRWMVQATREVETAAEALRPADDARVAHVDRLLREAGLPPGTTLLDVANGAPAPWGEILCDHHRALTLLVQGTSAAAALVGAAVASDAAATGEVLSWVAAFPSPSASSAPAAGTDA